MLQTLWLAYATSQRNTRIILVYDDISMVPKAADIASRMDCLSCCMSSCETIYACAGTIFWLHCTFQDASHV